MDLRNRRIPLPLLFLAESADSRETHREGQGHGRAKGQPEGVADMACPEAAGVVVDVGAGVEDEPEVDPECEPLEDGAQDNEDEEGLVMSAGTQDNRHSGRQWLVTQLSFRRDSERVYVYMCVIRHSQPSRDDFGVTNQRDP